MKRYFYKIKDVEYDEYNYYFMTDRKCGSLIQKAIDKWDRERDYDVWGYVEEELVKHGISFEFIEYDREFEY